MKKLVLAAAAGLLLVNLGFAESVSLSHLFLPGKTVLDLDGDGFVEKPALTIIVPDDATAAEMALAADIAARANLESLGLDLGLVRRASQAGNLDALPFPILIGTRLAWTREVMKGAGSGLGSLAPNQGAVFAFTRNGRGGIACVAGSEEALLRTGRAYFLRWPYLWEVWGRETGATFQSLEKDLAAFLDEVGAGAAATVVREALYEFPVTPQTSDALRALAFSQGQVKDLAVEVRFPDDKARDKARRAFLALQADQRKGIRTGVLSTPACAAITFELWTGRGHEDVTLTRVGATKRLLTPSFKDRPQADPPDKDFDLLSLLSTRGVYGDQDRDGIADALDAYLIIPASGPAASSGGRPVMAEAVAELASRLMLATAGGAFPVVLLDSEVQSRRALAAPILVGTNALVKDLVKTGKLKPPALPSGWGLVQVVPKAFGKSNALALYAEDATGLESTISYLATTFPYLDGYGDGHPALRNAADDFEKFLKGEKGAAEGFLYAGLTRALEELKGKDLESVAAEVILPGPNAKFEGAVGSLLRGTAKSASIKSSVTSLRSGKTVFEKEKSFPWEGDEALSGIEARLKALGPGAKGAGLSISVGLSESPDVRAKLRGEIERRLEGSGFRGAAVEVLSAYKQGYFWLSEKVLSELKGKPVARLTIRFSEEREDLTRPKRTYADPARWVQELYPVDEVLSRGLGLPLEKIEFEMKPPGGPVYEVRAYDAKGTALLDAAFTPRTREIPLFDVLPEWGTARVTCGWLRIQNGKAVVADEDLRTDLERFWEFYQEEVLKPLYAQIMKKTGQEPTFSKQPYFKRLGIELWSSEPDFRTGLDEEIVSSLEAIHDEIYFDTLDLLRGMTRFDPEDKDLPADASRSSAPGNVFPVIHPSLEGGPTRVKVTLEDWPGQAPEAVLRWREKGRDETTKRIVFPALKPKETRLAGLVWNGPAGRIEDLIFEVAWEKEADYVAAIDLVEAGREAGRIGLVEDTFRYPGVANLTVRLKVLDREKEERLPVSAPPAAAADTTPPAAAGESIVPTREILSPAAAAGIIRRLSRFEVIRSYVGGRSYEGRDVPVLELYWPLGKYVSLPRLAAFKPTLQVSARQHANEVSSTNYLLKYAELAARDPAAREALKKVNLVFEPVENPDGADLAYALQKIEPFHSLHAGRYGSLGVDIGYQAGSKPLLPEAAVRTDLYNRWLPDIFLNLHGYPSHEWVQPFSNYTPYLFRDYWIPKGWFTYFRGLDLSVYEPWREAGEALRAMIARELDADPGSRESNRKFTDRYDRWAARWAPHLAPLEIVDGVTIFAKRRASTENRLTTRARATFAEETPEVMDETATGDWLDFLCRQGMAYLRAHVKYLTQGGFETARIEEESQDRVRITFVRARPVLPKREGGGKALAVLPRKRG